MDELAVFWGLFSFMFAVSSIILINMWFEQKRHNKSLETLLTEIRDRLTPPG